MKFPMMIAASVLFGMTTIIDLGGGMTTIHGPNGGVTTCIDLGGGMISCH